MVVQIVALMQKNKILFSFHNLNYKKIIYYLFTAGLLFYFDRLTKNLIIDYFETNNSDVKINSFLNFTLNWNTGIGFGLLADFGILFYNLVTILIVTVLIILIYLFIKSEKLEKISFFIILVGAAGNLFDRMKYRSVPDFIDLHINSFHWYTFNLADVYISIGIVLLLTINFLNFKNEK